MFKKNIKKDVMKAQSFKGVNSSDKSILIFTSLFFLFLISLTFVSGDSYGQNYYCQDFGIGFGFKDQHTIKQNQTYTFKTHIYNSSSGSGQPLNNNSAFCAFHLYNQQGNHILVDNSISFNPSYDFTESILGSNFSDTGIYPYVVACFDNDGTLGGVCSSSFEVTPSGSSGNSYIVFSTLVILLIYAFTLLSFFYARNIPLTVLGGMAMMFLGVYIIQNGIIIFRDSLTNYIAYVTIGAGAIMAFWALLEQFEVI